MNKSYYTDEFPSMVTCGDSLWHERFQWWMNKIPIIMYTDVMDTSTILTLQGVHQWVTHYQLMLRQEVEYKLRRSLK